MDPDELEKMLLGPNPPSTNQGLNTNNFVQNQPNMGQQPIPLNSFNNQTQQPFRTTNSNQPPTNQTMRNPLPKSSAVGPPIQRPMNNQQHPNMGPAPIKHNLTPTGIPPNRPVVSNAGNTAGTNPSQASMAQLKHLQHGKIACGYLEKMGPNLINMFDQATYDGIMKAISEYKEAGPNQNFLEILKRGLVKEKFSFVLDRVNKGITAAQQQKQAAQGATAAGGVGTGGSNPIPVVSNPPITIPNSNPTLLQNIGNQNALAVQHMLSGVKKEGMSVQPQLSVPLQAQNMNTNLPIGNRPPPKIGVANNVSTGQNPPVNSMSNTSVALQAAAQAAAAKKNAAYLQFKVAAKQPKIEEPEPKKKGLSDLNDVFSMAGLDIEKEQRFYDDKEEVTKYDDEKAESLINMLALKRKMYEEVRKAHPLIKEVSPDVLELLACATLEFLRGKVERGGEAMKIRSDLAKNDFQVVYTKDPKNDIRDIEKRRREIEGISEPLKEKSDPVGISNEEFAKLNQMYEKKRNHTLLPEEISVFTDLYTRYEKMRKKITAKDILFCGGPLDSNYFMKMETTKRRKV
eukprot:TRINITY_DN15156_c0_g1_i1.p1 TRINITY_DN15156_c0_g1~~TRINITY_DN15156_c0_g1_i1.p1  ORF type:complete len:571 (+),score=181.34 TRINITY_DN15156_c0_g1_i1:162-1874(+)